MEVVKNFVKDLYYKAGIFSELLQFLWENKLWWSIPIVIVILLIMFLVIFSQSSGLAPFVYPLF